MCALKDLAISLQMRLKQFLSTQLPNLRRILRALASPVAVLLGLVSRQPPRQEQQYPPYSGGLNVVDVQPPRRYLVKPVTIQDKTP